MPEYVDIFNDSPKKRRGRVNTGRKEFAAPEATAPSQVTPQEDASAPQALHLTGGAKGKRPRGLVAAAAVLMLAFVGGGGYVLFGANASTGDVVVSSPEIPTDPVVIDNSEPTGMDAPTLSGDDTDSAEDPDAAVANAGDDAPVEPVVPVVDTVSQTIVIEYAPTVADLTAQDRERLRALAESLAPGEQIAVTGYAGFSATDEWADYIAPQRAETVRNYLTSLGATDILDLAQGTEPAINTAAGDIIAADGIDHNRLVVVTAVTLLPAQE